MIESSPTKTSRRGARERRREVGRHLAEIAPLRGPRRLLRQATALAYRRESFEESAVPSLRPAFEGQGPLLAAAGLYFASRPDLLPEGDCRHLAAIADRGPVLEPSVVRELLVRELGTPLGQVFSHVELRPFDVRLLSQSHRAWLGNGEPVTLELVRPEVEMSRNADLEALELFEPALAERVFSRARLSEALTDAREKLERESSPELKAADLAARTREESGRIAVPRVYRDLTTTRLLVTGALPGRTVADFLEDQTGFGPAGPERGVDLAFQLALLWLRQVSAGRELPIEPRPENVLALSERRLAFAGGAFVRSTSEEREALTEYLFAVADQDPDRALDALGAQLVPVGGNEELRRRFRQLVPLREDLGPGTSDRLSVHLLLHARLIGKSGFEPRPVLLGFYRGLFWIHETARRQDPSHDGRGGARLRRDVVRDALETLHMGNELGELRERMGLARLRENLDRHAALWMELPQKLDAVLNRASRSGFAAPAGRAGGGGAFSESRDLSEAPALFFALVALALLLEHFSRAGELEAWTERIGVVVFLALGGMLLAKLGRRNG